MIRAEMVQNKAGAKCLHCPRITFELRRVCPWCAKAQRDKAEADAMGIAIALDEQPRRVKLQAEDAGMERRNDVRSKQRQIESEGLGVNLADG